MGLTLLSFLLGLLPLLGIAFILYSGWLKTVDGLFMSLILLTLSGVFFLDVFLDLRRRGLVPLPHGSRAPAPGTSAARTAATGSSLSARMPLVVAAGPALDGAQRVSGHLETVQYYEAPVGTPDRTLVLLRETPDAVRMLVFAGDVRAKLLPLRRVTLTYKGEGGEFYLLGVNE